MPVTPAYALEPRLHMRMQVLPLTAGSALRTARRVLPLHSPALAAAHMGVKRVSPCQRHAFPRLVASTRPIGSHRQRRSKVGKGGAGRAHSMLYGSLLALSKLPIPQRPP